MELLQIDMVTQSETQRRLETVDLCSTEDLACHNLFHAAKAINQFPAELYSRESTRGVVPTASRLSALNVFDLSQHHQSQPMRSGYVHNAGDRRLFPEP